MNKTIALYFRQVDDNNDDFVIEDIETEKSDKVNADINGDETINATCSATESTTNIPEWDINEFFNTPFHGEPCNTDVSLKLLIRNIVSMFF